MIKPSHLLRAALSGTVLAALLSVSASAATLGAGTVTADALRLRSDSSEASDILATASSGDSVVVLEDAADGWYKVSFNTVEGYMSADYLDVATVAYTSLGYGLAPAPTCPLWPPSPAARYWSWRASTTAGIK